MPYYYCGIDPGQDGAIVVIDCNQKIRLIRKIPLVRTTKHWVVDISKVLAVVKGIKEKFSDVVGFLEHIHSAPGQGVVSAFTMGQGFGILRTALVSEEIPHWYVEPSKWKGELMDGMPREKLASIVAADRIFPGYLKFVKQKDDHNIADALLIAEWGRRNYEPTNAR